MSLQVAVLYYFPPYPLTSFLRRDAMLAPVLATSLCPSVCLSITRRYCVKTAERIQLIFGADASLDLCYIVLSGNLGYLQNKGTVVPSKWVASNTPVKPSKPLLSYVVQICDALI